MIFTVTLNPAVDKTVVIPDFKAGTVNRIQCIRQDAGGKGLNVSKCLEAMNEPSTAVQLSGGSSGQYIEDFIMKHPLIQPLVTHVEGDTRTNLKIIDPLNHSNTDINEPGPLITEQNYSLFKDTLFSNIKEGDCLILAGSIPKGLPDMVYEELIRFANAQKVKTFLDADGEGFLKGVLAHPYLIKPNIDELSSYCGQTLSSDEDVIDAALKLIHQGIQKVMVSMGDNGAIYVDADHCYRAFCPKVDVASTVGAGDSMVAALAYCESQKRSALDACRLAVAFGSASVTMGGTQVPPLDTVNSLYGQVKIMEV